MDDTNTSSWNMMTVLGTWAIEGSHRQDNVLLFMLILFLKVFLNTFILILCSQSLRRSFMGYSIISLYLVDCLLLFSVASACVLRERVDISISLCFILAHGSTVYSVLPLPVLLLGFLDHVIHLRHCLHPMSSCRALTYSTLVLLLWTLACLYSFFVTDTQVIELWFMHKYELCIVQNSCVVTYFTVGLFLLVICVLIFCYQEEVLWVSSFLKHLGLCLLSKHSDLPYSYTKLQDHQGIGFGCTKSEGCWRKWSPFLWNHILGFASSWAPFLAIVTGSWLMGFNIPSYVSFNLLWLLCANSFLVGMVFSWSNVSGLCFLPVDDVCDWGLYQTSVHREYSAQSMYILSDKETETTQHIQPANGLLIEMLGL